MKEVTIKPNRPHQTRFLPAVLHGETLYGPLFIGFLRKTALFPWTEPPLRRYVGGRAHRQQDRVDDMPRGWQDHAESFGAAGQSPPERRPRMHERYQGLSRISGGKPASIGNQKGASTVKSLLAYLRTPPKGYATWHAHVSAWWRAKPGRAKALDRTCKVLKYACYLLYPALLVMLAWEWVRNGCAGMPRDFLQALAVPAVGFVLVSLMRRAINEPRPYEACGIEKLIDKDTQGKSFPSRHSFSIAVIGMCWLRYVPAAGILILLASLAMAWARVLAGVHYPRDVVCGLALGVLAGLAMWL